MPNSEITSYNVELAVLTPTTSSTSRRKRQTAISILDSCIPGGPNRSIAVDASQTSLTVNNTGKELNILPILY